MTDAFIIETQGRTAGIAVRDAKVFQFYASDNLFWPLESRRFRTLRELHATVDKHIAAHGQHSKHRETRNTLLRREQTAMMGS
jgi:hypothetical protein